MSQRAIREYDAKALWSAYSGQPYSWVLVVTEEDLHWLKAKLQGTGIESFVVKPDQLFGKRGKHGLVWVKLDATGVVSWIQERRQSSMEIDGTEWVLDTFLVEEFVSHDDERYVAIKTERDHDIIYYSTEWGVEVEENRDKVSELQIPVGEKLTSDMVATIGVTDAAISEFIQQFYEFFVERWFAYLEVNPMVKPSPPAPLPKGEGSDAIVCLDMVARVDTCEEWKQKEWSAVSWVKPFGSQVHPLETLVEKMDAETWASLKLSILNPKWRIGLLLWWWWPSITIMDKFNNMWLIDQVINYWELSGNPNYRHNKMYIQWLVDVLVKNAKEDPDSQYRLCYIWWNANFTRIDVICKAIVFALEEKVDDIKNAWIRVFVRRGWINDQEGIDAVKDFCEKHNIWCRASTGDVYITTAMEVIE